MEGSAQPRNYSCGLFPVLLMAFPGLPFWPYPTEGPDVCVGGGVSLYFRFDKTLICLCRSLYSQLLFFTLMHVGYWPLYVQASINSSQKPYWSSFGALLIVVEEWEPLFRSLTHWSSPKMAISSLVMCSPLLHGLQGIWQGVLFFTNQKLRYLCSLYTSTKQDYYNLAFLHLNLTTSPHSILPMSLSVCILAQQISEEVSTQLY